MRTLNAIVRQTLNVTAKTIFTAKDGKSTTVIFNDASGKIELRVRKTLDDLVKSNSKVVMNSTRYSASFENFVYNIDVKGSEKTLTMTWTNVELVESKSKAETKNDPKQMELKETVSDKKPKDKKVKSVVLNKDQKQMFAVAANLFKLGTKLNITEKNISEVKKYRGKTAFVITFKSKSKKLATAGSDRFTSVVGLKHEGKVSQGKTKTTTITRVDHETPAPQTYVVTLFVQESHRSVKKVAVDSKPKDDKKPSGKKADKSNEVRVSYRKLTISTTRDGKSVYKLGSDEIQRFRGTKTVSARTKLGDVEKVKIRFSKTQNVSLIGGRVETSDVWVLEVGKDFLGSEVFVNVADLNIWLDIQNFKAK